MKVSLETRSKNLKEALINVLQGTAVRVVLDELKPTGDAAAMPAKIRVFLKEKVVCEIVALEKSYEVFTAVEGWEKKTTYSGVIKDTGFVYNVDTMDECIAEVERLVGFASSNKLHQNHLEGIVFAEDWPKSKEEQVRLVTSTAGQILTESQYSALINDKQPCTNICPIGKSDRSRDRIAAIWPKRGGVVDFLVKREIYEMINSRVLALGVDNAKKDGSEYVYRVSFLKLPEVLKVLTMAERS